MLFLVSGGIGWFDGFPINRLLHLLCWLFPFSVVYRRVWFHLLQSVEGSNENNVHNPPHRLVTGNRIYTITTCSGLPYLTPVPV